MERQSVEKTILSVQDVADRWGVSYNTVIAREREGHIRRLAGQGKRCYALSEVEAYENQGLMDPFSPRERKRLERENQILREENNKLKSVLHEITAKACLFVAGEYERG